MRVGQEVMTNQRTNGVQQDAEVMQKEAEVAVDRICQQDDRQQRNERQRNQQACSADAAAISTEEEQKRCYKVPTRL